jgi:DNA-binding MarR family transcriptional regulator
MHATATQERKPAAKVSAEERELARRLAALLSGTAAAGEVLQKMEETGLTLTQCKVLSALGREDAGEPSTAKDVAERVGASLPTISRAVDVLVRRDLVVREENAEDRRVRHLVLTEEGERLVRDLLTARMEGIEAFVASLTAGQRRKLSSALEELLEREEIASAYRHLREEAR